MILLKATTETLTLTTSTIADIDYSISYADITTSTFSPSTSEGKIITATTTTVLTAPAASTQRQVKLISITNRHASTTNTVVISKVVSGTSYYLTPVATLLAGESMQYMDGQGWIFYTSTGAQKRDGTTAAGANTDILYNNNGIIAGDTGLTYDTTNNILGINDAGSTLHIAASTTDPAPPPTDTLSIFARKIAGRMMTAQIGPSGLTASLQPLLARNKIGYWNPPGNSTTLPGVFGITALTAQGTATTRSITTTNLANRMRRLGYPSSTTAGTFAGARLPVAQFSCGSGSPDGSGFLLIERWVESDPAPVSGKRAFHGMTASTAAMSNVEVNTLTNLVGICQLSTDATQWYWYSAGSAAQTATAVGTGVGAPGGNSTTAWELAIYAPNSPANTYYLELNNITTGVSATKIVTGAATVCPQSTTLLAWNAWATNNATAAAVGIDLCSLYIETDN
jgi:hypothetical protein